MDNNSQIHTTIPHKILHKSYRNHTTPYTKSFKTIHKIVHKIIHTNFRTHTHELTQIFVKIEQNHKLKTIMIHDISQKSHTKTIQSLRKLIQNHKQNHTKPTPNYSQTINIYIQNHT